MNHGALAQFITPLILSILAICAVAARIWARRAAKISLGIDDWLIVVSLVVAIALGILLEWAAFHAGVGQPDVLIEPYMYSRYWKQDWLTFFLNVVIVGLVKVSIVCFYKRIFSGRRFQIIANILIAVSVAWIVYNIVLSLIVKIPLRGIWDITDTHPYTFDSTAGSIQSAATDIAIDLAILAIPIPMIRNLKTTMRRKLIFGIMFGLGIFCIIASMVRLVILVQFSMSPNASVGVIQAIDETALWAAIESYTSIVAACLPTFGPLWSRSDVAKRAFGRLIDVLAAPFVTRPAWTSRRLPSVDDGNGPAMMEAGEAPASPDARRWAHMWRQINPGTVDTEKSRSEGREEVNERTADSV